MVTGNPLARLWTDRCTVIVREKYTRENGSTGFRDKAVLEDEPCRLSFFQTYHAAVNGGEKDMLTPELAQKAKLFLSPDAAIPPGSALDVTRGAHTVRYALSGQPARYRNHQEIVLELFQRWA